jgi:hypothetical protein
MITLSPQVQEDLERHVQRRTGGRIRELTVELGPEAVVLRGRAGSYHLKQLAQHGIQELMPRARLDNAIVVEPIPVSSSSLA